MWKKSSKCAEPNFQHATSLGYTYCKILSSINSNTLGEQITVKEKEIYAIDSSEWILYRDREKNSTS